MKKYILAIIVLVSCFACQPTEDEKAAPLMKKIEMLYHDGQYQAALNAITQLRAQYPRAIKSRQRALVIWQDASLKMTQQDVGRTDSALQATIQQIASVVCFAVISCVPSATPCRFAMMHFAVRSGSFMRDKSKTGNRRRLDLSGR